METATVYNKTSVTWASFKCNVSITYSSVYGTGLHLWLSGETTSWTCVYRKRIVCCSATDDIALKHATRGTAKANLVWNVIISLDNGLSEWHTITTGK